MVELLGGNLECLNSTFEHEPQLRTVNETSTQYKKPPTASLHVDQLEFCEKSSTTRLRSNSAAVVVYPDASYCVVSLKNEEMCVPPKSGSTKLYPSFHT